MDLRTGYSLLLALSACLGLLLAVFARGRRRSAGAWEFGVFALAGSVYAAGYVGELWSDSLKAALLWIRFEYLGIAFLPAFWLLFALRFAGRPPRPALRNGLLGLSSFFLLAVLSMEAHGLFYRSPRLDRAGPFPAIAFDRGVLYWAWILYLWGAFAASGPVFLRFLARAPRVFRPQVLLVVCASLLPLAGNGVYLAGLVPYGLEPSALLMGLSACLAGLGLFRYGFLELVPIARERVLEALAEGVLVVDREGRMIDANPAAAAILGLGEGSGGKPLAELAAGLPALQAIAKEGQGKADFILSRAGEERRYSARAYPVAASAPRRACPAAAASRRLVRSAGAAATRAASQAGSAAAAGGGAAARAGAETLGTAIVVSDVTEEAELMRRLEELAATDGLTGLLNRRRFFELAAREVELARRKGRTVAVVLADLDHFKDVNDHHGHAAGDAVLKGVAGRFRSALRATDLSCRYGGEEFAFLFPESDLAQGLKAAERLRAGVAAAPLSCSEGAIGVTLSLGVSAGRPGPDGLLDLEGLLRAADEALYAAKKAGRNRVEPSGPGEAPGPR